MKLDLAINSRGFFCGILEGFVGVECVFAAPKIQAASLLQPSIFKAFARFFQLHCESFRMTSGGILLAYVHCNKR